MLCVLLCYLTLYHSISKQVLERNTVITWYGVIAVRYTVVHIVYTYTYTSMYYGNIMDREVSRAEQSRAEQSRVLYTILEYSIVRN